MGFKPQTPNPKLQMTKDKGQKTNNQKRSRICTIAALTSGVLGFSIGGLLSTSGQLQVCQTHPWGIEQLCSTWAAPGAFFRGGMTGLWVGTILGAFAAGVATHQPMSELSNLEEENEAEISWSEIQAWIEAASLLEPQDSITLTIDQTRELLEQLGFSEEAIDRARLPKLEEGAIERNTVEKVEKRSGEQDH
jgi:hypothetical protein